jgi:hypothetical protein
MFKKFIIFIIFLTALTLSNEAWSSVPRTWDSVSGTTWEVEGTTELTVKVEGYATWNEEFDFYVQLYFHPDGYLEINSGDIFVLGMNGQYKQVRNKVIVHLDPDDIQIDFDGYFQFINDLGLDMVIEAEVTRATFTAKIQNNGTLNGQFTSDAKVNILIPDYNIDLRGTVNVSSTFTGRQI